MPLVVRPEAFVGNVAVGPRERTKAMPLPIAPRSLVGIHAQTHPGPFKGLAVPPGAREGATEDSRASIPGTETRRPLLVFHVLRVLRGGRMLQAHSEARILEVLP